MKNNRRDFIRKSALTGAGLLGLNLADRQLFAETGKQVERADDPTAPVKAGFIGVGSRGRSHLNDTMALKNIEIAAICDIQKPSLDAALKLLASNGRKEPSVYTGHELSFEDMLKNEELDAVIIATPWEWHVPMSVASMKAGISYTAVEVSAANTLEECWDLVNVHEETGKELMILENVCYRRDVMAVLNMVRTGLFGELIHCRCGYEHDLRSVKFNDGIHYDYASGGPLIMGAKAYSEAQWRGLHAIRRNGDLYPTHGIGPVANYLDINRGNRFLTLSAMATKSRGLHKFIVDNGGTQHPYANIEFNLGDIVTSMIKCANGETIIVTHDTSLPRPYSLGFRVEGTSGLWYNDGDTIYVEGKSKVPHEWDDSAGWMDRYDHKYWREHGKEAEGGGHGGMDYIMLGDFFQAVRDKQPVPLDAYDAAAWSAVSALSEMSVARGGSLVDFPDFTRGKWIKRKAFFAPDEKYPIDPQRSLINSLF
jgi:predicted dehydrogenase